MSEANVHSVDGRDYSCYSSSAESVYCVVTFFLHSQFKPYMEEWFEWGLFLLVDCR